MRDSGADAYTLLTPRTRRQTSPQQLTRAPRPPPNYVNDSRTLDPTSVTITGHNATVRGALTATFTLDGNRRPITPRVHLAQQPDGSWGPPLGAGAWPHTRRCRGVRWTPGPGWKRDGA